MTTRLILKLIVLINLILIMGCTAWYQPAYIKVDPKTEYYKQIRDWQERVKKEGWSESTVNDVVKDCLKFSLFATDDYTINEGDYWYTPKEMIDAGFNGDCEDIASLIYGTFKRLEYPFQVRIMLVYVLMAFNEHVMIKVELPDGKWKTYDTIDIPWVNITIPFLEFDENEIWMF